MMPVADAKSACATVHHFLIYFTVWGAPTSRALNNSTLNDYNGCRATNLHVY
jgi:hypothetical protein